MEEIKKFKVIGFDCGRRAISKLTAMGIIKDSILEIITKQPNGPYTIKVNKSIYSIGEGLFNKIIMEELI